MNNGQLLVAMEQAPKGQESWKKEQMAAYISKDGPGYRENYCWTFFFFSKFKAPP